MKKPASLPNAGHSGGAGKGILADSSCPNASLCRRWSADENGTYCRHCWRDFTDPKPLQVTEGRA